MADGGEILGAASRPAENRHAEELFCLTEELLSVAGLSLRDLDAFAVDVGPGLFTGLRVGVSAVNALAYGLGRPVVAVSGTAVLREALARECFAAVPGTFYLPVPVLDVRRGEVAFDLRGPLLSGAGHILSGETESDGGEVGAPGLDTPINFCRGLADFVGRAIRSDISDTTFPGGQVGLCLVLAGSGAYRYREILQNALTDLLGEYKNVTFFFRDGLDVPPVSVLAELAYSRFISGDHLFGDCFQKPLYLREADAKVGAWKDAKLGK